MSCRTAFHLDCTPMIPDCGFECDKCVAEIVSTLTRMQGVSRTYRDDEAAEARIIVEHNPTQVAVEDLTDALKSLPSFHEGCFVPTVAS
jgi:hypothetical protein